VAYSFAGLFAKPPVPRPHALLAGAVWRDIDAPFEGVGIRFPEFLGKTPDVAEVAQLAQQLGLAAADWLYLTYSCWGGAIEFVYGFGCSGGRAFGPVEESGRDSVVGAFTGLMGAFGVSAQDALRFAPFERGYWGVA
jgi:hypothetical protein